MYGYLKKFDTKISQHIIPMKPQTNPFQYKLRKMYPNLEPLVKGELNKILATKIIFLVRHTKWIANLVHVRKKNGDIRLCVEFINLNRASEKYYYLVPPMEKILQCVSISKMLSLLDGFSGYNQVLVSHDDQLKIAFRTKWGTYAYLKIPFGLINVGVTFQRDMDRQFKGIIGKCGVVYHDNVTIFSKDNKDRVHHLRWIFYKCRRYDISLNPRKYIFVVNEGNILGFLFPSKSNDRA